MTSKLAKRIEADIMEALCGPVQKVRPTALRVRNGVFETVELNDNGKVIEPPGRCWECGPFMLCAEHMTYT